MGYLGFLEFAPKNPNNPYFFAVRCQVQHVGKSKRADLSGEDGTSPGKAGEKGLA